MSDVDGDGKMEIFLENSFGAVWLNTIDDIDDIET